MLIVDLHCCRWRAPIGKERDHCHDTALLIVHSTDRSSSRTKKLGKEEASPCVFCSRSSDAKDHGQWIFRDIDHFYLWGHNRFSGKDSELRMECSNPVGSQTYAQVILDNLPGGYALFDVRDLRLLAANTTYHSLLEPTWQQGRAIGHKLPEFAPYTVFAGSIDIFHQVAKTGIPYQHGEYASLVFDQRITYWNWTLCPIQDAMGQIIHLLVTVSDVTVQEQERQHLEVLEKVIHTTREGTTRDEIAHSVLHSLQRSLRPLLLAIYTTDAEQQTFHLLATTSAQAHQPLIALPSLLPYEHAFFLADAQQQQSAFQVDLPFLPEGRNKAQWATAFNLPGVRQAVCTPLWFDNACEGVLLGIFPRTLSVASPEYRTLIECGKPLAEVLAHDRFRLILEQERQRLRTVLDQLPEGVMLVEATTGTIEYANAVAASLLGHAHTSLLSRPYNQMVLHPMTDTSVSQGQKHWHVILVRALLGETVRNQEVLIVKPDGKRAVLLCSAAPIRTSTGMITGAVVVFQDVTAQKTLEQQKKEFFMVANHELRTPLTAILGYAELLHLQTPETTHPMWRDAISSIFEECEHLRLLLNETLDVTCLEQAELTLQRVAVNVVDLLNRVVNEHQKKSRKHDFRLAIDAIRSHEPVIGWFDQRRLEQALRNVVSNAIKYSPKGGTIEVGGRLRGRTNTSSLEMLLWVKDEGIGMLSSDQPHIFERFHRGKNLDNSMSGFGVGLYLTKEIIQQHRGRIWAESQEGQGSTFFFTLPLDKPDDVSLP